MKPALIIHTGALVTLDTTPKHQSRSLPWRICTCCRTVWHRCGSFFSIHAAEKIRTTFATMTWTAIPGMNHSRDVAAAAIPTAQANLRGSVWNDAACIACARVTCVICAGSSCGYAPCDIEGTAETSGVDAADGSTGDFVPVRWRGCVEDRESTSALATACAGGAGHSFSSFDASTSGRGEWITESACDLS